MSGQITALAEVFLRQFVVDGVPASGVNNPAKADGMATFSLIDQSITGGVLFFDTWAHLQPIVPAAGAHCGAYVLNDLGTHTDPVVGGAPVPNQGAYAYSTAPAGWQRVGPLDSALAKSWATLLGGTVDGVDYSAKEYAIGIDIRSAGLGSAKDWATLLTTRVDGAGFSSKEWATGIASRGAAGGGSAKDWATETGAAVDGAEYAAKEYAVGTFTRGMAGRGSAKDWATLLVNPVDGTAFSAHEWAVGTATRGVAAGGSAKDWATYMGGTVDGAGFSAQYWAGQSANALVNLVPSPNVVPNVPYGTTADANWATPITMGGRVFAGLKKSGRWHAPWRKFGSWAAYIVPGFAPQPMPTTAGSVAAGLATLTVANTTNLQVGQNITVAGCTPATYNGTFPVTAFTPTTLSYYPQPTAPTGPVTVQGTVVNAGGPSGGHVWAASSNPGNGWPSLPFAGAAPIQITNSGDAVGVETNDRFIRVVRNIAGAVQVSDEDMSGVTSAAAGTTGLMLIGSSGQSTSNGMGDWNCATQTPLNPGVVMMFDCLRSDGMHTGPRMTSNSVVAGPRNIVPAEYMGYLTDAREWTDGVLLAGESCCSGVGFGAAPSLPAHVGLVVANFAVGGSAVSWLNRGTQPWINQLEMVRRLKLICALNGWTWRGCPSQDFIWGEASFSGSTGARPPVIAPDSNLTGYATQFQQDFASTGQLVVSQASSWASSTYKYLCDSEGDRFLQAHIQTPNLVLLVGPRYMVTPYAADGVHYIAKGQRQLGCYHGRAHASILAGAPRQPLYITGVSLVGTTLTTTWSRSNLAFLTAIVSDPGQYGFAIFNTTTNTPNAPGAITLSGFAIAGNQVTMTLSAAPGAGYYLGVAYFNPNGAGGTSPGGPTTGPRCSLCSQSTDLDADGNAMHDWACQQSIAIS